eukprot:69284_1
MAALLSNGKATTKRVIIPKQSGGQRRMCIRDGLRYLFARKKISPKKKRRRSRTHIRSPTHVLSWGCAHPGCPHMIYTAPDGTFMDDNNKQHVDLDHHKQWTDKDIRALKFRNKLVEISKSHSRSLLDGFKEQRRYYCDLSDRLDFSKYRSLMYRQKHDEWAPTNPSNGRDIFQILISSGYHLNWFGWTAARMEKMHDKLDDEQTAFVRNMRERESVLYLGDHGTGEFQFFADKQKVQVLRDAPWLGFDGSFASAAKNKHGHILYPQVMNVVAIWPGQDHKSVASAHHCGTIHYRGIKCDKETYLRGLRGWIDAVRKVHGGEDVLYEGRRVSLMADMEKPLRNALREFMDENGVIVKAFSICWFHYTQAIGTNIAKKGLNPHFRRDGKKFTLEKYLFLRCYMVLALVHPGLVIRCWNILKHLGCILFADDGLKEYIAFIKYHQNEYMGNIAEWNQFRCKLRTNNAVECRNFVANRLFKKHPYWIHWVECCMKQFADSQLDYEYFVANGHKTKPPSEVLKEELLLSLWTNLQKVIDNQGLDNVSDEYLLNFMFDCSKAMKVSKSYK